MVNSLTNSKIRTNLIIPLVSNTMENFCLGFGDSILLLVI